MLPALARSIHPERKNRDLGLRPGMLIHFFGHHKELILLQCGSGGVCSQRMLAGQRCNSEQIMSPQVASFMLLLELSCCLEEVNQSGNDSQSFHYVSDGYSSVR